MNRNEIRMSANLWFLKRVRCQIDTLKRLLFGLESVIEYRNDILITKVNGIISLLNRFQYFNQKLLYE